MKKTNPNYKDNINNPNPKVAPQNFNRDINIQYKKRIKVFKIIIGIQCAIIMALLIPYTILYFTNQTVYFFQHFAIAIVLVCAGIVAFSLPMISKRRTSGDNKGDNLMIVAAILCFILAILTILMSYQSFM